MDTAKIENGKLVVGMRDCTMCHGNGVWSKKTKRCTKCNGTGKRGRGKCRECCKDVYSFGIDKIPVGHVPDYQDRIVCPKCNGNHVNSERATLYDWLPKGFVANNFPFRVIRSNRDLSFVESYIGAGIYSCMDYGRLAAHTDSEIIEEIKKDTSLDGQACKICDKDGNAAKEIVIVLRNEGYVVLGVMENGKGIF